MKGLLLSKEYYEEYGRRMIRDSVPEIEGRIAAGLVGEGSQCFGFDDEISRDHDFAPGFCLWLTEEDYNIYGQKLKAAYNGLPGRFMGFGRNNIIAGDRLGVFSIKGFYEKFTGPDLPPASDMDWLLISEANLAACTNGEIFDDPYGKFSHIRCRLLDFYPENVRRKKIAARAAVMSQAGQYNLLRMIRRQDSVAVSLCIARFTEASLSMIHLLHRKYMPFYKWAFRSASLLENSAQFCSQLIRLQEVTGACTENRWNVAYEWAFDATEKICSLTAGQLNAQGLSFTGSCFLQDHLPDIMNGITNPQIQAMPAMLDFNL